jgi:hypothetical protein
MTFAEATGLKPYRYDKPPHGAFGTIDRVGERLVCHLCGRDWMHLGTHAWLTHGLTAAEYREAFGLNVTTPLVGAALSQRLRESGQQLFRAGRLAARPLTREEMRDLSRMAADRRSGGAMRLEARLAHGERLKAMRHKPPPPRKGPRFLFCAKGHAREQTAAGRWYCRSCKNEQRRARYVSTPAPKRQSNSRVGDLCPQGHPWDGWIKQTGGGRSQRACRQCNRDRVKQWRREHRDEWRAAERERRKRKREA